MVLNIRIKDWVTGLEAGDKRTLIPSIRKLQFKLIRNVLGQCVCNNTTEWHWRVSLEYNYHIHIRQFARITYQRDILTSYFNVYFGL